MTTELNLGLKIKELMKKQNVSIDEASSRIGYTPQGFGKILKKKSFNTDLLQKICDGLGIELVQLFETDHSISQTGKANIGHSGNIQYKGEGNTIGTDDNKMNAMLAENEHLKAQLQGLREQNQLLREMVEMLKAKP